jgi:hypothetical protein
VELQPDGRVFQAEALLFQEAFAKSGDFANRAVSTSDRNRFSKFFFEDFFSKIFFRRFSK